ncbi:class A beta-lactamase-related serine hydrolase [Staphylococcus pragensis]|uniref:Class A beta-lactamase-related serine hydrolase n=1 Tax=Staphylococcus pragensis TaxID=1611836 RepID=A0A4Z1BAW5_9STAP|nr:serine hydrolase domain-containing protein [Staphylococcus pragensis]RTX90048.1 class A beta-lactamase-related serine hydrolase [Staphylococcus carnosus]TGN27488.1 class A beta-lactamase-related serine hydrolase [Staphylococcus pragensis]GGG92382.1 serine hydrolase FLP [Staphylococcus pragensis]
MKKKLLVSGIILLIIVAIISIGTKMKPSYSMFSPSSQIYIDKMITNEMKDDHIPGMSVLIIKHNKVFLNKGYGYANIDKKVKVSPKTRFEIASNTKAFTGYAIMQLVEDGKIKLNDKISKYIPGFYMKYKGKKEDITVDQLIAQTSGIPGDITDNDKITKKNNNLAGIVNSIKGRTLDSKPGKQFQYSNMNYDMLGLIVQNVSHESYSNYMKDHIFKPLNMHHSTTKESNEKKADDAQGYKVKYGKAYAYNPDFNLGDNPAAYMMTGTKDLEPWIRFQLNAHSKQSVLIKETHQPKVKTEENSSPTSYGTGWFIDESTKDTLVYHLGTLENYSSYIILNPKKDYGIVVLANAYSKNVPKLAHHLDTQMSANQHVTTLQNLINQWQSIIIALTVIIGLAIIRVLVLIYRFIIKCKPMQFNFSSRNIKIRILMLLVAFALTLGLIHLLPSIILANTDWQFIMSWLPTSAKVALMSILILLTSLFALIFLNIITNTSYSKNSE